MLIVCSNVFSDYILSVLVKGPYYHNVAVFSLYLSRLSSDKKAVWEGMRADCVNKSDDTQILQIN